MLKDLTFIASQCRCSARVYSGSAGRTASNAMTLATPGRGPLPAPFVVTLLSAGRLFFVSTLGQPPIERKAMPDAPGMDQPFASCSAQSCITRRQPRQPGSQIGTLE